RVGSFATTLPYEAKPAAQSHRMEYRPMTNEPGRHEQGSTDDVGEVKERLQREAEAGRGSLQRAGENVQRQASEVTSDLQAQAQKMVSEQNEMARSGLMDMV